jgi:hypothetical protein
MGGAAPQAPKRGNGVVGENHETETENKKNSRFRAEALRRGGAAGCGRGGQT